MTPDLPYLEEAFLQDKEAQQCFLEWALGFVAAISAQRYSGSGSYYMLLV